MPVITDSREVTNALDISHRKDASAYRIVADTVTGRLKRERSHPPKLVEIGFLDRSIHQTASTDHFVIDCKYQLKCSVLDFAS